MNMNLFKVIFMASFLGLVSGCASTTMQQVHSVLPTPDKIMITKKTVSINCKFLGRVSMIDSKRSMQDIFQHTLAEADEFAELKNQAFKLGANTIYLSKYKMTKKEKQSQYREPQAEGTHTIVGDAYICPETLM